MKEKKKYYLYFSQLTSSYVIGNQSSVKEVLVTRREKIINEELEKKLIIS